jgi:PAS domain S-box-containing protein
MSNSFSAETSRFFASLATPASLLELFEYLPDVYLYVKDRDGRFVKVNQTLIRTRGFASESEMLGKTDLDIHPKYWGMRYREEDQKVMASRQPLIDQVWLVPDADGRLAPFISSKLPLFDHSGDCIGIAGVRRPLNAGVSESQTESGGLKAAARTMTDNYAEPFDMKQLAKLAGLSHSQFNRRFQTSYRMSPSTYLQRVRVHEASRRLIDSDQPLSEIALETGFYDQSHLTRTFKKVLNVTPTEFRRIHREPAGIVGIGLE